MSENHEVCSPCEVGAALALYADIADRMGMDGTSVWEKAMNDEIDTGEILDFLKVVRAKAGEQELSELTSLDEVMRSDLPKQLKDFRECVIASKEDGFEAAVQECRERQADDNSEG